VLNEAALEAVRRDGDAVCQLDVYNAVDRVTQGIRRPGLPRGYAVRHAMAVHECGTAVLATLLHRAAGRVERVERVSLVPRGRCGSTRACVRARACGCVGQTGGQGWQQRNTHPTAP
jgi:ATP-dependent Zn protease